MTPLSGITNLKEESSGLTVSEGSVHGDWDVVEELTVTGVCEEGGHITTDQEAGAGAFWFTSSYPAHLFHSRSLKHPHRILRGAHSSKASHADKDEPLQRVKGELVKEKLCPERGGAKSQMCGGWRRLLEE